MHKKSENSLHYKSFFTRDYKSTSVPASKPTRRINRLHIVLGMASILVVGTLLTFFSLDASAYRNTPAIETTNPAEQIPLAVAEPAKQVSTDTTANLLQAPPSEWITEQVRAGDSMARIFNRLNLAATQLHSLMQVDESRKYLSHVQPGQQLKILVDHQQNLQALILELNRFDSFALQRDGDNYIASMHHRDVQERTNHAAGQIESSLFESGQRAGMSDALIMEMASIFGWDIDFALDIRNGDHFALVFEEHFLDGEKIDQGPILAAEFVSQNQVFRAVRYTDVDGNSNYYTPDGLSMRKAFLRTPVDFRRISSRFGSRHHPILNKMKLHKGVDYSAPIGTPIRASGDGKLVFKGLKGGYGRTIMIQHGGKYSTLYAHMSAFKKGINNGSHVRQGQVIGYVGSSGLATGPHLHYEFRVNGVHRNPLTIKLPNAEPIADKYKAAFLQQTQPMLATLDTVKQQTSVALHNP